MSDLIGRLAEAIREHALPSCSTYKMMIDCADEIKMLRQRVIDCDSCIERREQINAQMQVENEGLQARVAEIRLLSERLQHCASGFYVDQGDYGHMEAIMQDYHAIMRADSSGGDV